MAMRVWIDQDLCTGDGICVEIANPIFGLHDDGLAYVKEQSWATIQGPDASGAPALAGPSGMASVPDALVADVVESAEECPGECIFIEVDG
jgi:ferredoxin